MAKTPKDRNQLAAFIVAQTTGQPPPVLTEDKRNPLAVALGALGASKGGKARAEALTKKERKAIAKKAAKARWANA